MLPEIEKNIKDWARDNAGTEAYTFDETRYCALIDGVHYAISHPELLKEPFDNFANWLGTSGFTLTDDGYWFDKEKYRYNFNGVFSKYLESLNK